MSLQERLKKRIKNNNNFNKMSGTTTRIEGKETTFKFVNDYKYNNEIRIRKSKIEVEIHGHLKIPDYSMLCNIYKLNLHDHQILNTKKINNVCELGFANCFRLESITNLKNVNSVYVYGCRKLKSVHNLEVRMICINMCFYLKEINGVCKLNKLELRKCDKIKNIGHLRKLTILKISNYVNGLELLKNLEYLQLYFIPCKKTLRQITKLKKINPNLKVSRHVFEG